VARDIGMAKSAGDAEAVGVGMALERTYALEARLRAAIQSTHSLSDSLDRNPVAADREREALLNITCAREATEIGKSVRAVSRYQSPQTTRNARHGPPYPPYPTPPNHRSNHGSGHAECGESIADVLHDPWPRREQLELLGDKLREFSSLGDSQFDDKVRR
jgi:hypothetical protein